ncbi:lactate racemase domain-containing protein [Cytobacillus oceanisediminis]|uniref:lactate racemase domain-containing protein n=1 Tax=Cytobacillus oceanisediminis TaxID=665099 RepID=UPI0011A64B68|nr:lactate racemase domain-containing protein [Cytobacillus oceanisediminis]
MFELYEIEQQFPDDKLSNLKEKVHSELKRHLENKSLPKNAEIAITAGSRGISNIVPILKETADFLKNRGFKPFLVPAMGSHGRATAEGQIEVLRHLGITEDTVGAEIRSSMEVELLGHTPKGQPVYMDKNAYHSDGILVINRIKAHTAFRGRVESGLSKMVTIGLGKIKGATFVHSDGALKMAGNIEEVSLFALKNSPVLMGLAIIENGYDETADIAGVSVENWHSREEELLHYSKAMMPSLPVNEIDLLLVEEMGKCFSGTGMDPNIIGRWRIDGVQEPEYPAVSKLAVLDLAEKSFGNAQGIGLADFTTQKLVDKMDRKSTYTNALTATYLRRAMLPMIYDTEKEAVETAVYSLGPKIAMEKIKIVQIPNTLHLNRIFATLPVIKEMEKSNRKFNIKDTHKLSFDQNGDLQRKLTVHQFS